MTRRNVTDEQYSQLRRRTDELVRRVDEGTIPFGKTMNVLQMLIEGRFVGPGADVVGTFKVLVDYAKSLAGMIEFGEYDNVNSDITSDHFPVKGTGQEEKEITLFFFNRSISSGDAILEMAEKGYRPAFVEELLSLGTDHKELQKQFPIVALGSVWQHPLGDRRVPSLYWDGAERSLRLPWFERDWREYWRFAAVRK